MPAAVFKIPFFSPGSDAPHVLSAKAAASDAFNPLFMLSATDPLTELAKAPLSSVLNTPAEPAIAAAPAAPPKRGLLPALSQLIHTSLLFAVALHRLYG